jgi:hypothetical protein
MRFKEYYPQHEGNLREDPRAFELVQKLAKDGCRWWYATWNTYQFNIFFDANYKAYSATWKNAAFSTEMFVHKANFIGDDIHPEAKLPFFKTMSEAARACNEKKKELRK